MKTINDLLILEGMKEGIVLAGHRGLTRNVQFVNISDTPDVINFLSKNHLLLTTGYAFKDDPEKFCELIQQMHDLNCSGLVIKINRFFNELPAEVRLLADDLAFPIIDLPTKHTLGDVSRHILNYLNDAESEQLYYALHIQKEFSNMLIKGYSLAALLEQLGHSLARPALLLNHRGEKIAQSHDFLKESMKVIEQEIIQKVKENLPAAREGTTFSIPSREQQSVSTFPVQTKRQYASMLVIFDSKTLPYPSSQMAIEQAGNVISFTIIKEQAIEENSRLLKNNFFADLIEMKIQSDEEITSRANYYGLEKELENVCVICTIDADGDIYETLQLYEKKVGELHNSVYDQLEDELIHGNLEATLFTKGKYFVMILQFPKYDDEEIDLITAFTENVQASFNGEFSLSFGVSHSVQTLKEIPTAYDEAVEAILTGYDQNLKGFVKHYKTRDLKELLNTLSRKDLKALYENTLKSLAYPKTKDDQDLVKTIQVYLDSQCEFSETSRKLFVHRNTVKYRIEKTEELLNCSLRDPADSLRIRVALVIGSILKEDEEENS
ncbi:PucR family transcriptional regulator [Sporosarcina highlanderae]|uniref:PucR family transcriptional regulator ligand-binding domain-containing protein n=1 Tax=Sporosarcina highlanderae TaxID=3035916 RepID=A0ABT8JU47_9BACL|nr:PucR family transcriptional regulator [Sporosarcina highlanderae]MDN4608323.1 PucR family transcriptional regulator ligand-binding domain-containing protein [Sporosarcina highlanderae]